MKRARPLLGTYVEIEARGLPEAALERAIDAAFNAVELVQRLMSFHDPASDLSMLNRRATSEPIEVHPWTAKVLRWALSIYWSTDGWFDCAIGGELVNWQLLPDHGFGRADRGNLSALRMLPNNRVFFTSRIALDLGGIAKGFAVDRAITILRRHGVRAATINAGGDLRVIGREAHPIYLRDPADPVRISLVGFLRNGAIATSSAAATLTTSGGRKVSALVTKARSPLVDRTNYSVIARTCLVADALTKVIAQVKRTDASYFERFGAIALISGAKTVVKLQRA
jgi:thiamine biosynthesis lipoprotein